MAIVKGLTPTRIDSSNVSWMSLSVVDSLEPGTPFMSGTPGSSATARPVIALLTGIPSSGAVMRIFRSSACRSRSS